jgi:hypothetical protein
VQTLVHGVSLKGLPPAVGVAGERLTSGVVEHRVFFSRDQDRD